jgi:hypothetical protein
LARQLLSSGALAVASLCDGSPSRPRVCRRVSCLCAGGSGGAGGRSGASGQLKDQWSSLLPPTTLMPLLTRWSSIPSHIDADDVVLDLLEGAAGDAPVSDPSALPTHPAGTCVARGRGRPDHGCPCPCEAVRLVCVEGSLSVSSPPPLPSFVPSFPPQTPVRAWRRPAAPTAIACTRWRGRRCDL